MKKNDLLALRKEEVSQLKQRLVKEKKELFDLRLELNTKKVHDTKKIFHKRKTISQILTIINEKRTKK